VFVFFGLMSVLGMHYILYSSIDQNAFLLSVFMGTMSVGVLHLNNMRDIDDDAKAGKITVALRLGWRKSKWYLFALFALGFGSLIYFMFPITKASIALVAIPLLFMLSIRKIQEPAKLDPFLKKLALVVFFNAIFVFILTRF
jgi:1,4-dihydroxy-2-naphthoate octaprenyltransferase